MGFITRDQPRPLSPPPPTPRMKKTVRTLFFLDTVDTVDTPLLNFLYINTLCISLSVLLMSTVSTPRSRPALVVPGLGGQCTDPGTRQTEASPLGP